MYSGNVRPMNINRRRPRVVRNLANEELVLDLVHADPELSVRRIASRTGISPSVVWRILHQNNMYPYHRQRIQELLPRDYPARLIFSQTIIDKITINPNFLKIFCLLTRLCLQKMGFLTNTTHICGPKKIRELFV